MKKHKHKHKWGEETREDHIPGVLSSFTSTCECGATRRRCELADEVVTEPESSA